MRKFFILNLSSLHPYGKPYLGYTAWRWFALLGDGSRCSVTVHAARRWFTLLGNSPQLLSNSSRWLNHEFDCSALFALARTSSRWCCTMDTRHSRTSCGGYDPGYPRQTTWAAPPRGGPAHKTKPYGALRCSARPTRHQEDILKILRDLLGYV